MQPLSYSNGMLAPFDYILWDWNGTLLDDTSVTYQALCEVLAEEGLRPEPFDEWRRHRSGSFLGYYKRLIPNIDDLGIKRLTRGWATRYESRWRECSLHSDAEKTLRLIQNSGRKQSILSAHTHAELHKAVEHMHIKPYFEHVIGTMPGQSATNKVDQGAKLLATLSTVHNLPKTKCVLVGDSQHDIHVAQELKIACILVDHGICAKERLAESGFPVVSSLALLAESL